MPFHVPTGKLQIILKISSWSVKNQFLMIFDALANNIFPVYEPGVGYIQNFVVVQSYIF